MLALYGGTFNPVHVGHLHVANTVCERLGLTQLGLVLSARPPHRDPVPVEHRWQMLQLACADQPRLYADDREMRRTQASFTIDTLRNQRRRRPFEPLFWVIGMDSLLTFRSWYRWWRILDLAHLVVVRRPGYPLRLDSTLRAIVRRRGWIPSVGGVRRAGRSSSACRPPGVAGRIVLLEEPMLRVSSSAIRQQLQAEGGRAQQVLPSVADYITEHKLYNSVSEAQV